MDDLMHDDAHPSSSSETWTRPKRGELHDKNQDKALTPPGSIISLVDLLFAR